jgi:hypothetical protein
MTLYQKNLAEQASTEMNSTKLLLLVTELCNAIDEEHVENRHSQSNCLDDCRENARPFICD